MGCEKSTLAVVQWEWCDGCGLAQDQHAPLKPIQSYTAKELAQIQIGYETFGDNAGAE